MSNRGNNAVRPTSVVRRNDPSSLAESAPLEIVPERCAVLVVDDERGIVEELIELLESRGFQAIGARCVADALAKLEANPSVALVITDLSMPQASGLDLIRACRRPELCDRRLHFVLATGQTELTNTMRAEIEDAGVSLMLKPIRPRELLKLVSRGVS